MDDQFEVEVTVHIAKSRNMGYGSGEQISYTQKFQIPAVGFTRVAWILGNLDEAIGSIKEQYPWEPK